MQLQSLRGAGPLGLKREGRECHAPNGHAFSRSTNSDIESTMEEASSCKIVY